MCILIDYVVDESILRLSTSEHWTPECLKAHVLKRKARGWHYNYTQETKISSRQNLRRTKEPSTLWGGWFRNPLHEEQLGNYTGVLQKGINAFHAFDRRHPAPIDMVQYHIICLTICIDVN